MIKWMTLFLLAAMGYVAHAQRVPTGAVLASAPEQQQKAEFGLNSLSTFVHSSNGLAGASFGNAVGQAAPNQAQLAGDVDPDANGDESDNTGYKASSYVPLDSWIYPAFDRLAALGFLPTSSATLRPWTRLECARLLAEAHSNIENADETTLQVLSALDAEFAHETDVAMGTSRNTGAQVGIAYGRYTELSGTPLRDSYHFAQTLSDDYGRPYAKGSNGISGLSLRAEGGMFSFYVRGEYQYAPTMPTYNTVAQQTIANSDRLPFGWNLRLGTTSRPRTIEAYAALNLANWQLSFGQESLWWGPNRTTSLILSNNAEAMPMLRLARVKPMKMPGLLRWMGPVPFELFLARQGGVHYVGLGPTFTLYGNAGQALNPPPYIWGIAASIKPTVNLEIGLAHTTIFAGYGRPLNLRTFLHTFSPTGNNQAVDPGKRTTEFNLTYHPPGFRNTVIYEELYAYDTPLEGRFLAFYAMDPGIYIPRIRWLTKLDLRMEGVYTDLPGEHDPAYYYENEHYIQGYTGYGQILGSWIGRQGDGGQASSSYWFSARSKATISYRKMSVDKAYLHGGNLDNISGSYTWMPRPDIEVSATGQFEQWKFPLLSTSGKSDFATILEIRTYPKIRFGSR